MRTVAESSDEGLLELLQRREAASVGELAEAMGVTATAVRQRLSRLMGQGLVERSLTHQGRGRPSHRYALTEAGLRRAGSNFTDLALALWSEIRAVEDPAVRRGLLKRLAGTLAAMYGPQVRGSSTAERMESVRGVFAERDVPFRVDGTPQLPVLTALACPYPDLAARDRGICALEKIMLSELVQDDLRLTSCRLDGATCCTFETT